MASAGSSRSWSSDTMPKVIDGDGVIIDGAGARATAAVKVIDSFERNSSSPGAQYFGQTDEFAIRHQDTLGFDAVQGERVLYNPAGNGFSAIYSTSGLPFYFPTGTRALCYVRTPDTTGRGRIHCGVDGSNQWYNLVMDIGRDDFVLVKAESDGSRTTLDTAAGIGLQADTWYAVDMGREDGTLATGSDHLAATIAPDGGSSIGTVSTTDGIHSDADGVGFSVIEDGSSAWAFDFYHR